MKGEAVETMEWKNVDKSLWQNQDGEWMDEPDKKQWVDKETGLACLIVRAGHGSLCGYVGVSEFHEYFGKDYSEMPYFGCHGGLTFSSGCQVVDEPGKGVCHIPAKGKPDNTWWFGFDCAHLGDLSPANLGLLFSDEKDSYRNMKYVEGECKALARQIANGIAD